VLSVSFDMQHTLVILSLCAVNDTVIRATYFGTFWQQVGGAVGGGCS
jgi:hypothetical protein